MRLRKKTVLVVCITSIGLVGLPALARAASDSEAIPWTKDFAEAKKLAKKTGRPIIVFWKGVKVAAERDECIRPPKQRIERIHANLFPKPKTNPRTLEFIWIDIDFEEDKEAVKAFGIDEQWAHFADAGKGNKSWAAPDGFVFASAEGKIYGRLAGAPIAAAFDDMMAGGHEKNLERCLATARKAAQPHFGGYSNWESAVRCCSSPNTVGGMA